MNRHEMRKTFIFSIYQHLLLNKSIDEMINNNFEAEIIDPYIKSLEENLRLNENNYIILINSHLNKWTFDRLNYVDQAILLTAVAELSEGSNDKAVILDEAIKMAKEYCDEDSFKYINGVLDKI